MIHPSKPIEVFVADSTPLSSQLIVLALQRDADLHAVDTSRQLIVKAAEAVQPHVVILSYSSSEDSDIVKGILARSNASRVIALVNGDDLTAEVNSLKWGARGIFWRSRPVEMLIQCVKHVHKGLVWINEAHLEVLLAEIARPSSALVDALGAELLSRREQEVIGHMKRGFSNREIAQAMRISESTAKNYIYRIFNKLGVSNRVEAVMYAGSQRTDSARKPISILQPSYAAIGRVAGED